MKKKREKKKLGMCLNKLWKQKEKGKRKEERTRTRRK